jgi:hypothetical protein
VLAGGLSPLIAAALLHWTHGAWWAIAAYMVALASITLISVYLAAETSRETLDGRSAPDGAVLRRNKVVDRQLPAP